MIGTMTWCPIERPLQVRVGVVLAGLVVPVRLAAGASFSSHSWKSWISPSSQSLTYTPA